MRLWHAFKALAWYCAVCGKRNYSFKITPMIVLNRGGWEWYYGGLQTQGLHYTSSVNISTPCKTTFMMTTVVSFAVVYFRCMSSMDWGYTGLGFWCYPIYWKNSFLPLSPPFFYLVCHPHEGRMSIYCFWRKNVGNWQALYVIHEQ